MSIAFRISPENRPDAITDPRDISFRKCTSCGLSTMPEMPAKILIDRVRKWPDFIKVFGYPTVLVSKRVSECLVSELGVESCRLSNLFYPDDDFDFHPIDEPYYYLDPPIGMLVHSNNTDRANCCELCGVYYGAKWKGRRRYLEPRYDTWDGTPVFKLPGVGSVSTWYVYCSFEVVRLAREHQWTNVTFPVLGVQSFGLESSFGEIHRDRSDDWIPNDLLPWIG